MKKLNYQTIKGRCFKALIVLLLAPLSSWAQNLTVGGVEVTSGEYLVSDNIEGLVSFDAETNTLTLEDATITGGYMTNGCITSGLSHLTICLIGENKICSNDSSTAIRSTANEATLTIVKGADNCKLVFDALRCIRDFKTVSFDGLSWNGAYTYEYDNAEWDAGYRLMGADGNEATSDTGVLPTLVDPVPTMSTYSGQTNETRLFLQNDFDLPMYYSIDYVSNDLQDVSATQYTEAPELLGPCTVTAYVKKSNGVNGTSVVGKYFGFVSSSVEALSGQNKPVKPELIPAFGSGEYEEFSVDFVSERQEDFKIASPDGMELYIGDPGIAQFEAHLYDLREVPTFTILNARVEDEPQTDVYYQLGSFTVTVSEPTHYGIFLNGEREVTEANMLNVLDDEEVVRVIYDGKGTLILNGFEGTIESSLVGDLTLFLKGQNTITSISSTVVGADINTGKLLITTDKQAPGTLDLGSLDATAKAIRNFSGVELLNDLCWIKGDAYAAYAEVGIAITPVVLNENTPTVVEPDNDNIEDLQTPPASIPNSEKVEVKKNEGEDNETTTIIINKVVDNVLVTLVVQEQKKDQSAETYTVAEKVGDPLTEGGGNATRNAFVLQTPVGEDDVNVALTKTPGTPDYAKVFHGLTLLVAAGSGDIEIDVDVPANAVLNVKIGNGEPISISGVSGVVKVPYVCKEPSYVYIYNATPQVNESRGYRRAKVTTIPIKMFSFKSVANSVQAADAPEDAAKPEKLLSAGDLESAIAAVAADGVLNIVDPDLTTLPDDIFNNLPATVTNIDLSKTAVKNVTVSRSADGPFKGVSENTFIYLPAGNGNTAAADEPNVVIGAVCEDMQLAEEGSQPFSPVMNFGVISATLGRDFVNGITSTVYLPFAVDKASADALGSFYTFTGITAAGDAGLELVTTDLAAKTPYIFKKSGDGKISVKNVSVTTDAAPVASELIGTFEPITWTSEMLAAKETEQKYVYGFAAADQGDDIQAGEFVRVGVGATIKAYRAYLEVAYNAARIAINWGDEATGIRTLQPVKAQEGWYTIGGARLVGAPSKAGLYIYNGKKTIVNGK